MNHRSWIKVPHPRPQAGLRLLCFPFAGGGASFYYSWAEQLPAGVELCPVQLPGRENRLREPAVRSLQTLVLTLAEELAPCLDKPFAFFGHSMGALISFELTRELRRRGQPLPLHLFLSARGAPHVPGKTRPLHPLAEGDFLQELRRHGGTPETVLQDRELLALFLPILRADFTLVETHAYGHEEPLPCAITVFGGTTDQTVDGGALGRWQEQTSASFTLRLFAGDHFFLQKSRKEFLEVLSQELAQLEHAHVGTTN